MFFGGKQLKKNSSTLYRIDNDLMDEDCFLNLLFTKGNVFGSDQVEHLVTRKQALPPVYFPEASFPADFDTKVDDESSPSTEI